MDHVRTGPAQDDEADYPYRFMSPTMQALVRKAAMKPASFQIEASQFIYERDHSMLFARMGTGKTLTNLLAMQDWLEAGVSVPICDPPCGGVIKPRTIMFGEAMPSEETEEAERRSRAADLFIVVGSSLVVYPAAHMPVHAKRAGARLVIVNRTPTPQDAEADLLIPGSAAEALAGIAERVHHRVAIS